MTIFGELLERAVDLWDAYSLTVRPSDQHPLSDPPIPAALDSGGRKLAAAIAVRRGVSVEAAEDMVRWLRTQHQGLSKSTGAP